GQRSLQLERVSSVLVGVNELNERQRETRRRAGRGGVETGGTFLQQAGVAVYLEGQRFGRRDIERRAREPPELESRVGGVGPGPAEMEAETLLYGVVGQASVAPACSRGPNDWAPPQTLLNHAELQDVAGIQEGPRGQLPGERPHLHALGLGDVVP